MARLARDTRSRRLALRDWMRAEAVEAQSMSFGDSLAVNSGFFLELFAYYHVMLAFIQDALW